MAAIKLISILLAIICIAIILLVGILTNLLREPKGSKEPKEPKERDEHSKTPYSFSRFQLWLWTLVISPAFILNWGFTAVNEPSLNLTCLILLGIPAGVTLTAGVITSTQESTRNKEKKFKRDIESKSFWTDILMDDSEQFSIARLQQLIFTLAYVIIFVSSFFYNNMTAYPEFNDTAFVLMGISGGTYLIGKGMGK